MRKGLALGWIVAALAAGPTSAIEEPRRGGDLVFAVSSEPNTNDCHALSSSVAMQALAPHYSTLLKFDVARYPQIAGDLAESWTVSPDQLVFTFRLREGVRFHDGSTLTATDVAASLERLRNPPSGVTSIRRASFADVSAVEAPDERTVVVRMREPNGSMLSVFASPWNCIYSKARLDADSSYPARAVMGSGPFTFVRHENGSHWIGRRFEDYFRTGRPYLDGFRAVLFPSSSAMLNAMQGGQVMTDFRGLTPAERTRLVETLGDRAVVDELPEITHVMITFNIQRPPLDDARVRRALSLAIDRWGAEPPFRRGSRINQVGGLMRPAGPFAASQEELERLPGLGRDINVSREEARRLLREAGHPNLRFVLRNRSFAPFTEAGVYLIDQWRRIGVTVEHQPIENAQWASALGAGNFDAILDFSAEFVDEPAFGFLKYLSHDISPSSAARFQDRELDGLYRQIVRITGIEQRLPLVRAFERRLFEQAYSVPFLWAQRIIVRHAYVRGWTITPNGPVGQDLSDVWLAR